MKQFILFLGGPKCGSSAIQGFLFFNRHKLMRRNQIIYIDKEFGRNQTLSVSHSHMLRNLKNITREEMRSLMNKLSSSMSDAESCVFASEGLCSLKNCAHYAELFATASDFFNVKIIIYVRNQVNFIHSAWKQWGIKLEMYDIDDYIAYCIKNDIGNWFNIINAYKQIPDSEIFVRPFHRKILKNKDIVDDFCELLSITNSLPYLSKSNKNVNISLDDFSMHIAINACLLNNVKTIDFIHYLKKKQNTPLNKLNFLINSSNSQLIHNYYSKFNDIMAKNYSNGLETIFSYSHQNIPESTKFDPIDCIERVAWIDKSFKDYTKLKNKVS